VLGGLYDRLKRGLPVDLADVDAALRLTEAPTTDSGDTLPLLPEPASIRTRKRQISARSVAQGEYIRALRDHALVFGLGPAGTGKTYLAVAAAVDMLMTGQVQRIILSRPAVEAGERLGFLPGDLKEKVDPYLRPLYDALHDMLPGDQIIKRLGNGDIEVAPLAFMRGRTLAHAFVILDEAQNTTPVQMKMFLTRLGEGARMAVTGDLSQIDLPRGTRSGLTDALETLDGVEGIGMVKFTEADVVRHPLVMRIVRAYEARDRAHRAAETGGTETPSA
jgi:phosphate starvation-inducible PhoH-like protein